MYQLPAIPDKWKWFPEARYGLFLHWGPYAALGRGCDIDKPRNLAKSVTVE